MSLMLRNISRTCAIVLMSAALTACAAGGDKSKNKPKPAGPTEERLIDGTTSSGSGAGRTRIADQPVTDGRILVDPTAVNMEVGKCDADILIDRANPAKADDFISEKESGYYQLTQVAYQLSFPFNGKKARYGAAGPVAATTEKENQVLAQPEHCSLAEDVRKAIKISFEGAPIPYLIDQKTGDFTGNAVVKFIKDPQTHEWKGIEPSLNYVKSEVGKGGNLKQLLEGKSLLTQVKIYKAADGKGLELRARAEVKVEGSDNSGSGEYFTIVGIYELKGGTPPAIPAPGAIEPLKTKVKLKPAPSKTK